MKPYSYYLILALTCLALIVSGCGAIVSTVSTDVIVGSGKLVTQDYALSGFDSINAGSSFKVNVHQGDRFGVTVTADDNLMPLITVVAAGGELKLGFTDTTSTLRRATMKTEITLPALKALTLVGNAAATLDGYNSPDLVLHLNSNNGAEGSVQADKLLVDSASNAQSQLTGAAGDLIVKAQGNAVVTLEGLTAQNAYVDMGSNAKVSVKATGKLDYFVGGNAGLTYSGGARLGRHETAGNGWARGR